MWDEHWFGSTKTLDVHVAAVRRKLGAAQAGADADHPGGVGRPGVHRVVADEEGEVVVVVLGHRCSWDEVSEVVVWAERSRASAREAVLFTVPTETPSSWATSCSEASR